MFMKYYFNNYPQELAKKVLRVKQLFGAFKLKAVISVDIEKKNVPKSALDSIYVKEWMRTDEATIFKLSNKIIQVNFSDNSRIIIDLDNALVTYLNKSSEITTLPILDAFTFSD